MSALVLAILLVVTNLLTAIAMAKWGFPLMRYARQQMGKVVFTSREVIDYARQMGCEYKKIIFEEHEADPNFLMHQEIVYKGETVCFDIADYVDTRGSVDGDCVIKVKISIKRKFPVLGEQVLSEYRREHFKRRD